MYRQPRLYATPYDLDLIIASTVVHLYFDRVELLSWGLGSCTMFENVRVGPTEGSVLLHTVDDFLQALVDRYGSRMRFALDLTASQPEFLALRWAGQFGTANCMQRWMAFFPYGTRGAHYV